MKRPISGTRKTKDACEEEDVLDTGDYLSGILCHDIGEKGRHFSPLHPASFSASLFSFPTLIRPNSHPIHPNDPRPRHSPPSSLFFTFPPPSIAGSNLAEVVDTLPHPIPVHSSPPYSPPSFPSPSLAPYPFLSLPIRPKLRMCVAVEYTIRVRAALRSDNACSHPLSHFPHFLTVFSLPICHHLRPARPPSFSTSPAH